jgi:FkbM family methyltransferase
MSDARLHELAIAARRHLESGQHRKAEYLFWEIVGDAPKAARSTYLLGVAILLQRRFEDARRLIDRAYALRPDVEDHFYAHDRVPVLRETINALPTWDWPRNQIDRADAPNARTTRSTTTPEGPPSPSVRMRTALRARRALRGAARRLRGGRPSGPAPREKSRARADQAVLDHMVKEARRHLRLGHPGRGGQILRDILRITPKAPTVQYLAGVAALLMGRFEEARRRIDGVYERRPWIDDHIGAPMALEALEEAKLAMPEWEWARYQTSRERWRAAGLSVQTAVSHLAAEKGERPTFVHIGANDGSSGDPLRHLIQRGEMKGLLVEPQPEPFARLQANYAHLDGLAFENAAVTDFEGPVEMLTASSRTTIGSLTPERTILHLHDGALERVTVDGRRFDTIVSDHGLERFDMLQTDTEGYDYKVLRQVDTKERGVTIVNLEYFCLPVSERLAVCERLETAGFALQFSRRDVLAVDKSIFGEPFCITDISAVAT